MVGLVFHEHVDLGLSGDRLNACGKVGEVGLQLFVDVGARLDGKGGEIQQAGEGSGKRGLHQLRQVFGIAKVGFEKRIVGECSGSTQAVSPKED